MTIPSQHELNDILRIRREKVDQLRARGINPFPYRFEKDSHIADLLTDFDAKLETEEHTGAEFTIAGRVHTMRIMGKAAFCHLRDETGEMQVYVQKDRVGEEAYDVFRHMVDLGDIVGFRGTAFRTKTNEPSLRAKAFELLAKSLRPLPVVKEREGEVYDAFTDKEARYRQRYVDLAVNPDVRKIFSVRAKIIRAMRDFLDARGFLEVETPALQPLYGGALARPFTTYYNALDRNFFLRIADELYLKRLIVGGYEKVYEICKDFRNEGMDRYHNPEFTMLEFYQAYADFEDIMNLAEELFRFIARAVILDTASSVFAGVQNLSDRRAGLSAPPTSAALDSVEHNPAGTAPLEVTYQSHTVDFAKPFRRVHFYDLLKELTGRDLLGISLSELTGIAKQHHIEITKDMGEGKILDELMKTHVRPKLIEPTMVYDYPLSLSPLAKKHRDDPRLVERFQPFVFGFELGNAFSELNDPIDQRERFEAQRALKEAGDEETQPVDEDYLRALEYGMPPTGGMGIGVDRLTMLLTDQTSIREVILFPQMRT